MTAFNCYACHEREKLGQREDVTVEEKRSCCRHASSLRRPRPPWAAVAGSVDYSTP